MDPLDRRIVVDGNDGTGKTTLVQVLRCLGFRNVEDRGEMSEATLDSTVQPAPDTTYILLTCDWQESKRRLIAAGKNMAEKWHTDEALQHYDTAFQRIAPMFDAKVIKTDQEWSLPSATVLDVLWHLNVPLNLGGVLGKLKGKCALPWPFDQLQKGRRLHYNYGPLRVVWARSRTYPQMVAFGCLDSAVVGSDVLEANPYASQVEVVHRVPQVSKGLPIRVAVASRTGKMPETGLLKVVTPFPEWAQRFFGERGIPHTIYSVGGGSEGLVTAGIGDVLFDIVETGVTLRDNGLKLIEEVGPIDTCIIRRRA